MGDLNINAENTEQFSYEHMVFGRYLDDIYMARQKGVAVIITMIVLFIGCTCVLTYFGLLFWHFYCFMSMSGFTVCGKTT